MPSYNLIESSDTHHANDVAEELMPPVHKDQLDDGTPLQGRRLVAKPKWTIGRQAIRHMLGYCLAVWSCRPASKKETNIGIQLWLWLLRTPAIYTALVYQIWEQRGEAFRCSKPPRPDLQS